MLEMPSSSGVRLVRRASGDARQVAEAAERVAEEFKVGKGADGAPAFRPLSQKDATHVVRTGKETYLQVRARRASRRPRPWP